MNSRRSGDSLERAWPPAATGSGEVSVGSEFERSEDEDNDGRVRASKSKTCETSPERGSSRPKAEKKEGPPETLVSSGPSEKPQLPTLPPGGAVPSALVCLTSLFGMGRGGSTLL